MKPKISIVTATYNSERYVRMAIESVLLQNYSNCEHIIVDGASQDATLDIIRGYGHLKWISEPDSGMTEALNKGFRLASGDIIGWLNSDDIYLENTFKHVVNHFLANPTSDLVYGSYKYVDEVGNYARTVHNTPFSKHMLYYYGCFVPSTATFFRRKIIDNGQLLDESYQVTMDYEFFLRLATLGYQIHFLPKVLASFRLRSDNIGHMKESAWVPEQKLIWTKYSREVAVLPLPFMIKPLTRNAFRVLRTLWRWYYGFSRQGI